MLLRPQLDGNDLHLCAGAVALAGADACRELVGLEPVDKWPNDLLLEGAKLAGVLAEAEFAGSTLTAVVVGIGINVAWPGPPEASGICLDDLAAPRRWTTWSSWIVSSSALEPRCVLLEEGSGAACPGRRGAAAVRHAGPARFGGRWRGRRSPAGQSAIDDAGRLVVETALGAEVDQRRRRSACPP